jgi:hypothetical protein
MIEVVASIWNSSNRKIVILRYRHGFSSRWSQSASSMSCIMLRLRLIRLEGGGGEWLDVSEQSQVPANMFDRLFTAFVVGLYHKTNKA